MSQKPCIVCGEVSEASRCEQHQPRDQRQRQPRKAGYDGLWDRLSRRARRIQPWCSRCGSTERLEADHSPEAWRRKERGQVVRLVDVDVLCHGCNVARGSARGNNVRDDDAVAASVLDALTRGDAPTPARADSARQQNEPLHLKTILNKTSGLDRDQGIQGKEQHQ